MYFRPVGSAWAYPRRLHALSVDGGGRGGPACLVKEGWNEGWGREMGWDEGGGGSPATRCSHNLPGDSDICSRFPKWMGLNQDKWGM